MVAPRARAGAAIALLALGGAPAFSLEHGAFRGSISSSGPTPFDLASQFLVLGGAAQSEAPAPAPGKKADEIVTDAKDLFTMQCAVAYATLPSAKYTPYKKLKSFCDTTDQVVACKQVVIDGLEKAVEEGNRPFGEMAFSDWCGGVWSWFEKKYGQNCLEQCQKWQCHSTCDWMKNRTKYDDMDLAVYEAEEKIKDDKADLKHDREDLRRKREKLQRSEGEVASSKRKAEFAAKQAKTALELVGNATEAETAAKVKAEQMQGLVKELRRNVSAAEGSLSEKEHDEDLAQQGAEDLQKQLSRAEDKEAEQTQKVEGLKTQQVEGTKDADALQKMAEEDAAKVTEMQAKITEDTTTATAKGQALTDEEAALAAEVKAKPGDKMLDVKAKYLKEERDKLKAFQSEIDKEKHEKDKTEQAIGFAKEKIQKMRDEAAASQAQAEGDAKALLVNLKAATAALRTDLAAAKATVATHHQAATAARSTFEAEEEKHMHAEKTLPFLRDAFSEAEAKHTKLVEDEKTARNDVQLARIKLNRDRKEERIDGENVNVTSTAVTEFEHQINVTETSVNQRRTEVDDLSHALDRKKPFIVEYHDLAAASEKGRRRF